MFFEKDVFSFHLLDVMELNQRNVNLFNSKRDFCALSFRFDADAYLKTEAGSLHAVKNAVCFVPERVDYTRTAVRDELVAIHLRTANYAANGIEMFMPERPDAVAKLFREIAERWTRKEKGYKYRCSAIVYEILAECYAQNVKEPFRNEKIKNSVAYMTEHYTDPDLSVEEIAERSYMCEGYFRKLFRREYGVSPRRYIIRLRMENAKNLLLSGYYSLKEVADLSGYKEYKYFLSEFRRFNGVTPSEFIRRERKE